MNKKNKLLLFAICLFFFVIICSVCSINVDAAYNGKCDISRKEPIILTEGELVSFVEMADSLFVGEIRIGSANIQKLVIKKEANILQSVTISNASANTTYIPTSSSAINSALTNSKTYELSLDITYRLSASGSYSTQTVPLIIKYNNPPVVNFPHIIVSAQQLYEGTVTENFIIGHIQVSNSENNNISQKIENFEEIMASVEPGTTTKLQFTVEDLNKTVVTLGYLTVLPEENDVSKSSTTVKEVRPISKDNYPYHFENIKKDSAGNYYAKKDKKIYYYLDDSGKILEVEGKRFAVDACLPSQITLYDDRGTSTTEDDIFKVKPLSKWVTDSNCATILISALYGKSEEYISSWTFDADDVTTIRKMLSDDKLDNNFYYNYYSNGYCKLGTRLPNQTGRAESFNYCGDGLVYYYSNNTLYIDALPDNGSYTYKMYDYWTSVGFDANDFIVEQNGVSGYYSPIKEFDSMLGTSQVVKAPWTKGAFNKVVLSDKITHIGNFAFYNCTQITEPIEIPKNCSSIGNGAFANCYNISGGLSTKNVYKIGNFAFYNCNAMTGELLLGDNALTKIGDFAFTNSGFTKSLKIPSSVSEIGIGAFMYCRGFSGNLVLSDNISSLGKYAFYHCDGFDGNLHVPNGLKDLGDFAFAYCSGFNGVLELGDNLTRIGNYAFYRCYNVAGNVVLPEPLTTIGNSAFKDCRALRQYLIIKKNLSFIGSEAFSGCSNITDINIKDARSDINIKPRAFYNSTIISTRFNQMPFGVFAEGTATGYNFFGDNRNIENY